jgi:hypothetical protein
MNLKSSLSESLSGLRGAIGRARLSAVEIVFLGAALLFAGFVVFFYLNTVQPLGSALAERQQRITDLNAQIKKLKTEGDKLKTQTSNAERILESLRGFENLLKSDVRGMTQIMNEVESLAKTHQLLSEDSTYRSEEADEPLVDENGNPIPQAARRDKKPKIYPTLRIDTSVIGDYANLRRFLSELERSKQFLIINALTFQGDDRAARQAARGGKQIQLSPESIPVSLGIELDTYFKPPTVAAVATAATAAAAAPTPAVSAVSKDTR